MGAGGRGWRLSAARGTRSSAREIRRSQTIAAEERGEAPQDDARTGRDGVGSTGKTRSSASRRLRKGSETARRALRAFARPGDRSEGRLYELDGIQSARLKEEADRRGATEREVLEEAVRLYLAGRGKGEER